MSLASKLQTGGDETQRQRRRADKGDFLRPAVEHLRRQLASVLQDLRIDEPLLVALGGLKGVLRDRLGDPPRQRANAGMGEKNLFARDGKFAPAQLFIG